MNPTKAVILRFNFYAYVSSQNNIQNSYYSSTFLLLGF